MKGYKAFFMIKLKNEKTAKKVFFEKLEEFLKELSRGEIEYVQLPPRYWNTPIEKLLMEKLSPAKVIMEYFSPGQKMIRRIYPQ